MSTLDALPTPCLLLDRARVEASCAAMRARITSMGARLRPHLKTAKSIDVARIAGLEHGITVSTLAEAEHFARLGVLDLTYAVGLDPARVPRIAGIVRETGARIAVLTDDLAAATRIGAAAEREGITLPVLIELDVGQHRGGIAAESETLLAIGRAIHTHHALSLEGVLAHAGHAYGARSIEAIQAIAEDERALAVLAAARLRRAGLPAEVVSVGSTPTATHARSLAGVTEVRAGVYVFGDRFQHAIGSCGEGALALSVLAPVIGVRRSEGVVVLDAGALALSHDRSMDSVGGSGFGEVRALDGAALPGRPVVASVNQEHGLVPMPQGIPSCFEIGARVRVLPNHACITAAMHDRYHVLDGEGRPSATWPRVNGF